MYRSGPTSGWGGFEFSDDVSAAASRVMEVRVRAGGRIDAIQIVHELNGKRHPLPQHGGPGGQMHVFTLDANELLIGIRGTLARSKHKRPQPTIHTLQLITNKQRSPTWGGGGSDSISFEYMAPQNTEIVGFFGRAGGELDGIGVIYRRRSW